MDEKEAEKRVLNYIVKTVKLMPCKEPPYGVLYGYDSEKDYLFRMNSPFENDHIGSSQYMTVSKASGVVTFCYAGE